MYKSKLHTAKIKLSKLREKYSNVEINSDTNSEVLGSEESSTISIHDTGSYQTLTTRPKENGVSGGTNVEIKSKVSGCIDEETKSNSSSHKKSSSHRSYKSKPSVSIISSHPGSEILSELSNKFENIKFLSSSTDSLSSEEEVSPTLRFSDQGDIDIHVSLGKLTSRKIIDSNGNEHSRDLSISRKEKESDMGSLSLESVEELPSIQSEEVEYESNFEIESKTSQKENIRRVDDNKSKDTEIISDVSPDSTNIRSINTALPIKSTNNNSKQEGDKEKCVDVNKLGETKPIIAGVSKPRSGPKSSLSNNKSVTQENNAQVMQCSNNKPKNKLKHNFIRRVDQNKRGKSLKQNNENEMEIKIKKISKNGSWLPKHRKQDTFCKKYSIVLRPSKRPTLKSCVLVQSKADWNSPLEFLKKDFVFDLDTPRDGYEALLREMLKSQIQLTRHFIQSHHQMYLQCCQAVKSISEDYVKNSSKVYS